MKPREKTSKVPDQSLPLQPEWCRVTLASISDAVMTTDTAARVTFLNPVAESLTGWTLDEAAGQPLDRVFRIINEESRKAVESPTVRVLREGVIIGLANHALLIAKDGTERPIDDSAAPIRNEQGEVAGVVLVFRDISERKQQEELLAGTLAYAENIIATLRHPFLVLDKTLRVVTANRSFYQNFQVTPEATQGEFIYDLGNRQWDIPRLRMLLEQVLPDNEVFEDFEVEHDFPTIGRKFMQLNARRINKPGNHTQLILLAIEDIAASKLANEQLEISEIRYRRLFEAAKDGILILDAKTGLITDANPFMSDLLGYSPAEFDGKEMWEIGLFSDKSESQAAVRELQQTGYKRYEHLPLESEKGRKAEVEIVANVYQEDHTPVIQCNIRDITERRSLEKQLHDRTHDLANLNQRKDEFLAMLSHELRNPLAPILSAVQFLNLHQHQDPHEREAFSIIERQLGQLSHLVNDLMEVSRISTGRIQLHQERLAVNGIVEHALETARPLIERQRHQLTVSLSPEPIWLNADAARLEQVIVNLLTNASKYTKDGGRITLTVGLEVDEATRAASAPGQSDTPMSSGADAARLAKSECVIRVRDTGIGIEPSLLPRIFELFTQAERSLDRSQGGLGIGLALVQRLTQLHGGKVEAYSALGHGSEFVVRLPLAMTDTPAPKSGGKVMIEPTGPSLNVLVVDDNLDAARMFALMLKNAGHQVRMAHTGEDAWTAILDDHPHLVLLDIGLPGLNGYELAKRIRDQALLDDVVLVAVTGYGQEADLQSSLKIGFNYHFVKPVDFRNIQQVLAVTAEKLERQSLKIKSEKTKKKTNGSKGKGS